MELGDAKHRGAGWRFWGTWAIALAMTPTADADGASLDGFASVRAAAVESPRSWRSGGFGRFDWGEEGEERVDGVAQLDLLAAAGDRWSFFVHGVARAEPQSAAATGPADDGWQAGVIEAYGEWNDSGVGAGLTLRLGHFLLPTSRENVELGWSSPYTLTFSALNSWIGEEVRVNGVAAFYRQGLGELDELHWMAVAFGGNDSAGTLLAWRGFVMTPRLTVYGETLPLPPLRSLQPGGAFAVQQDAGSQPFGSDLDGDPGYFAGVRWRRPDRAVAQLSYYDNRGDRRFHQTEYAWATRFTLASVEWQPAPQWTLLGEAMWGKSGMGLVTGNHVDVDFTAAYALASYQRNSWRASVRLDHFTVTDRDGLPDNNDSEGTALTAALFYASEHLPLRWGFEFLDHESEQEAALEAGFPAALDGRSLSFEIRYYLSPR